MKVILCQTSGDHQTLGAWVAQIKGLPQARVYGTNPEETLGKLILTMGAANGLNIEFLPASELDAQRAKTR